MALYFAANVSEPASSPLQVTHVRLGAVYATRTFCGASDLSPLRLEVLLHPACFRVPGRLFITNGLPWAEDITATACRLFEALDRAMYRRREEISLKKISSDDIPHLTLFSHPVSTIHYFFHPFSQSLCHNSRLLNARNILCLCHHHHPCCRLRPCGASSESPARHRQLDP
jgi:hypothetical protein